MRKSMPCPDMYGGSFVKGGNFADLKDVALAASLFYYKKLEIRQVKEYLQQKGVAVRCQ